MDTNTIATLIQAINAKTAAPVADPIAASWPILMFAIVTLIGHISTYVQNRSAQLERKDTAKIVAEIKTDVNSKSDASIETIKQQRQEITTLSSKIGSLEERLSPRVSDQSVATTTTTSASITQDQYFELLSAIKAGKSAG